MVFRYLGIIPCYNAYYSFPNHRPFCNHDPYASGKKDMAFQAQKEASGSLEPAKLWVEASRRVEWTFLLYTHRNHCANNPGDLQPPLYTLQ